MDSKIITADGTETFINQEYNEAYHSTKAGAYTESLLKFVLPCKIDKLSKEKEKLDILDVGFGLGYNVAVCVKVAKENNPDVFLNIFSIEKDTSVFEKIRQLNIPDELKEIYRDILKGKFENSRYIAESNSFRLEIVFDDARKVLKKINKKFDAVFYDAFSPKVNTEMWTVEIFRVVKDLMKEEAVLSTYSASLAVRKGLLEAGFKIGLVEPVGRKSYSTVATIKGDIPPLTEKEKTRIEKSPYAVPYRDNEHLNLPREVIKENWKSIVNQKLRKS
ncbi:tRNA U34 5-methylaminomethyl-2-thiouridine-forming methyltransferase MnmC [Persephonella hydrogeniphila]|uniref:tRNA U34 5-methylaminomethyl-2-thiouridine-forming methyltransferase MnmC n=1 Tax=Persephonella hydrogeniphila TaxID=198703 RepID=A0A285N260_9AQUI|nr:MnmC family methyltransferase [Persephonella hydrogeniphila]SNZ03529.1 tRNA U34 5-methylaminomethyl-2-thiouridine-forming methyltransferase MnmC [Persephonella hydrogeniphila]